MRYVDKLLSIARILSALDHRLRISLNVFGTAVTNEQYVYPATVQRRSQDNQPDGDPAGTTVRAACDSGMQDLFRTKITSEDNGVSRDQNALVIHHSSLPMTWFSSKDAIHYAPSRRLAWINPCNRIAGT